VNRFILSLLLSLGCSGAPTETATAPDPAAEGGGEVVAVRPRMEPPASGPARDVSLPPITRTSLANGLEVNAVPTSSSFPLAYLRLVIRSGFAADPAELPGLAGLVANMLKEGTRTRTSAEIAETIEYLGADLQVGIDPMQTSLTIRGTADQLDAMMAILADVAMNPRFDAEEFTRLQRRETERLVVSYGDASVVARREFYRAIYGEHPYNHVDATPAAIERARTRDLTAFHRTHYVPGNAFLVVAGAVTPETARAAAESAFGRWRRRPVPTLRLPELPARTGREVIVVHRPGSQQSVINIGNLALARNDADWIPLEVANEILGGSASARLFMDLRERRSLTYGAYSGVDELAVPGPFRARGGIGRDPANPELDRSGLAMDAFMEHLVRITTEAPSADEVRDATQYLSDSFPLSIDTIGRVAWMVGYLRIFGLPDDYWDGYRSAIRSVTPEQALAAARAHIDPEHALIVVVGDATTVAPLMRRWGPVRVVDIDDGHEVSRFDMEPAPAAE
jgi:zinc protease